MIRIYLKLRAKEDVNGWKKGDILEMENNIFDENTGFAYHKLDNQWEILKMDLLEFKQIHK